MNGIIDVKIDTDNGNISPDLIVGDIVISKTATGRDIHTYRAVVNKVTSDTITLVATTQIDCDKAKLWVRIGNVDDTDRQAFITMESEGADAPRIAMYDGVNSLEAMNDSSKLRLIIGKLEGKSIGGFLNMTGYGLYADNVYLKGDMILGSNSSISFVNVTGGQDAVDVVDTKANTAQSSADAAYDLAGTKITSIQATQITNDTVTTSFVDALEITSVGAIIAGTFSLGNGKFIVDALGKLTAVDAVLSGKVTSSEGDIAGFALSGPTGTGDLAVFGKMTAPNDKFELRSAEFNSGLKLKCDFSNASAGTTDFKNANIYLWTPDNGFGNHGVIYHSIKNTDGYASKGLIHGRELSLEIASDKELMLTGDIVNIGQGNSMDGLKANPAISVANNQIFLAKPLVSATTIKATELHANNGVTTNITIQGKHDGGGWANFRYVIKDGIIISETAV